MIAPDSFKGSLSSNAVAEAIAVGWRRAMPESDCVFLPIADGGEGTVQALVRATGGSLVEIDGIADPLGRPITSHVGTLGGSSRTAIVEVASASGLPLVEVDARDAGRATSYGTGQLISEALALGARKIVLGLGGSACTDGGVGLLQALGARVLDGNGHEIARGGRHLRDIDALDLSGLDPRLRECEVVGACDVDSPLHGPLGAAAVFAPQKGADAEMVSILEAGLTNWADVIRRAGYDIDPATRGSGAAGGIGFTVVSVLRGRLLPGFDLVAEAMDLDTRVADASLVITGEGRLDAQSLAGKVTVGVLRMAARHDVPCFAIVGSVGPGADEVMKAGMSGIFTVIDSPGDLASVLARTGDNIARTAESIGRVWRAAGGTPGEPPLLAEDET